MSKLFKFEVTGSGHFPLDMLRYDTCWPSRGEDVNSLLNGAWGEERTVILCSNNKPTEGRWASFGWRVTRVHNYV